MAPNRFFTPLARLLLVACFSLTSLLAIESHGVVKSGGFIRLLEYVRPKGRLRRIVTRIWQPWIAWAYGASFDRQTEKHVPAAGIELVESRYVVDDLLKLLTLRVV